MSNIKKYIINSSPFGAFKYDFKDDTEAYDRSKVVIVGVPYDGTATFQSGARNGPDSILNPFKILINLILNIF